MVDRDVLRAVAGVPLKSNNEIVGVLGLASLKEEWHFAPAQVETLKRFAELAAVALDNAQLYDATRQALEKTQRIADREKASAQIADKLYAAPDLNTVLRTAAEELQRSTGSRRSTAGLPWPRNPMGRRPECPGRQVRRSREQCEGWVPGVAGTECQALIRPW